ncbi:MAG: hypothetical protein Ct9H300mP1_03740 [Planctomycetaceae bacterium]|nr:MAG: hypothetical protein Ct9H300mP1_03740 [Planctomycetaceae bacterium]
MPDPAGTRVLHSPREGSEGFRVELDTGETIEADAVVMAVPCGPRRLVAHLSKDLSDRLSEIESASSIVVSTGYGSISRHPSMPTAWWCPMPRGVGYLGPVFASGSCPGPGVPRDGCC